MKMKQFIPKFLKEEIRIRRLRNRFSHCKIDSIYVSFDAKLEDHVNIGSSSVVEADVRIGRYSYVGSCTQIISAEIGAFCSIGNFCSIGTWEHPLHLLTTSPRIFREIIGEPHLYHDKPKHVTIGNDVWIGNGVYLGGGGKSWKWGSNWSKCRSDT